MCSSDLVFGGHERAFDRLACHARAPLADRLGCRSGVAWEAMVGSDVMRMRALLTLIIAVAALAVACLLRLAVGGDGLALPTADIVWELRGIRGVSGLDRKSVG